jgi:hypothetical protein
MAKKAKNVSKKKGASVSKTTGARIPLKSICSALDIDPKRARVKLRRAWRKEGEEAVQFHSKGSRWDLTPAEAKEVRAILAG